MINIDELVGKKMSYWEYPINKKARNSFDILLKNCNFASKVIDNKLEVRTPMNDIVGKFLIVGARIGENPILHIPVQEIKGLEDDNYIAVVLFNEEIVEGVFLFKSAEAVLGKNHRLFKNSPKENLVGIKIKKYKKKSFQNQKFGVILNKFIKLGEK